PPRRRASQAPARWPKAAPDAPRSAGSRRRPTAPFRSAAIRGRQILHVARFPQRLLPFALGGGILHHAAADIQRHFAVLPDRQGADRDRETGRAVRSHPADAAAIAAARERLDLA